MARQTYSGEEIIRALSEWRFKKVDQTDSHVQLPHLAPNTGEKRTVMVPLSDELSTGTLRNIADPVGAEDLQAFLEANDDVR